MLLLAVAGAVIAVGVHTSRQTEPDRVARAMELFRTYCLPYVDRRIRAPQAPLIPLPGSGEDRTSWADPTSKFMLTLSARDCSVSDQLLPMNNNQRLAIQKMTARLVESRLPMLRSDSSHGFPDNSAFLWSEFPVGDPRRWGVGLNHFSTGGEEPDTLLMVGISQDKALTDQWKRFSPLSRRLPAPAAPGAR